MIEEEVNEISRAYVTDYWFDDVEKDVTDLLNSDEWETVPQGNEADHEYCFRYLLLFKNMQCRLLDSRWSIHSWTCRTTSALVRSTAPTAAASIDHERLDGLSEE